MSNINGVLISRSHNVFRLAKQTPWGDEYVVFAYTAKEAWEKLARITGRKVLELKNLPSFNFSNTAASRSLALT